MLMELNPIECLMRVFLRINALSSVHCVAEVKFAGCIVGLRTVHVVTMHRFYSLFFVFIDRKSVV